MEVNMGEFIHGLIVTVIGMGITFLVLIILSYVLDLFRILAEGPSKKEDDLAEHVEEINPIIEDSNVEDTSSGDDLELVAAITAAIAASMDTTADRLVVRSFRRIGTKTSKWNNLLY
jgi:sodium pump decarboxylase gamma subunit